MSFFSLLGDTIICFSFCLQIKARKEKKQDIVLLTFEMARSDEKADYFFSKMKR